LPNRQKLAQLADLEGFASVNDLIKYASYDCVSPAICTNSGCDFTAEMEPDQDEGFCEACRTRTVQSALVLAELV
jgi:hypothetical protein